MFSKGKIKGAGDGPSPGTPLEPAGKHEAALTPDVSSASLAPAKPKSKPSRLSPDLTIVGTLGTPGDILVEGTVEGDIRAHCVDVSEGALVKGEIIGDDVVVEGRVTGRICALKLRLTSTARVEGDIQHRIIAIESGAIFEGTVQRRDDPLDTASGKEQLEDACLSEG